MTPLPLEEQSRLIQKTLTGPKETRERRWKGLLKSGKISKTILTLLFALSVAHITHSPPHAMTAAWAKYSPSLYKLLSTAKGKLLNYYASYKPLANKKVENLKTKTGEYYSIYKPLANKKVANLKTKAGDYYSAYKPLANAKLANAKTKASEYYSTYSPIVQKQLKNAKNTASSYYAQSQIPEKIKLTKNAVFNPISTKIFKTAAEWKAIEFVGMSIQRSSEKLSKMMSSTPNLANTTAKHVNPDPILNDTLNIDITSQNFAQKILRKDTWTPHSQRELSLLSRKQQDRVHAFWSAKIADAMAIYRAPTTNDQDKQASKYVIDEGRRILSLFL